MDEVITRILLTLMRSNKKHKGSASIMVIVKTRQHTNASSHWS